VVLRAALVERSGEEGLLRFEVSDTGIGIPDNRRDRLFKLFSQVDTSTTRRFGGTGLGLALCQRLTELFGGKIGVDSVPGQGSTFWFTARMQLPTRRRSLTVHRELLKDRRVLILGEASATIDVMQSHLTYWGMQCELASEPERGLELLTAAVHAGRPHHLAILDLQMLGSESARMLGQIRRCPGLAELTLVTLSSLDAGVDNQLKEWNVLANLLKPIRHSRLLEVVQEAVSRYRASGVSGSGGRRTESTAVPHGCERILVAEDNEINQIVVAELLKRLGLGCVRVATGQQAVEAASTRTFDAVLMDCQMPVLDGFSATQRIRQREELEGGWSREGKRLPIIALTANAVQGDRVRCLRAGMDDYLTKPIDYQRLSATLGHWLALDRLNVAGRPASDASPGQDCIDYDQLLSRCCNEPSMVRTLLDMFLARANRELEALEELAADMDRPRLQQLAHALKGVAGNLAATELYRLTGMLEQSCREETTTDDALRQTMDSLSMELRRCRACVPMLLQAMDDSRLAASGV
ncbi:MAG: response regulator, partial [Pirellulaceae bacterium]